MARNSVIKRGRGLPSPAAFVGPSMDPFQPPTFAIPMQSSPWEAARALLPEGAGHEDVYSTPPGFETSYTHRSTQQFFEYGLLEQYRPEVASLARFAHSVNVATFYLCIAFQHGSVRFDLNIDPPRRPRKEDSWFTMLVDETFQRFGMLRRALMLQWTPPAEVEPLTYSAFSSLCELAPAAKPSLKKLFISRREHAVASLVDQLDLVAKQLEEAVKLADVVEVQTARTLDSEDDARLASNQSAVLALAGQPLGLSEAAKRLGTTRQNLHKRISTGSALGVMQGRELVVPSIQFVHEGDTVKIVPHLRSVTSLFRDAQAGDWSLLQFLSEHDPMLDDVPMEKLKRGEVEAVVAATRAYLGLDEE